MNLLHCEAARRLHCICFADPETLAAMHEVLVRGHSLRRIETAMQRSELSLLTGLSGKQRSLIPDGQPVVLEIVVTEIKDGNKQHPEEVKE